MTNKIIIPKPGFNALTETAPDNLVFSSDYNTLKYAISGNTSISFTNPTPWLLITDPFHDPVKQEYTIATHNLGYYPFFTASISGILSAGRYINLPYVTGSDSAPHEYALIYCSTTEMILKMDSTLSSKTLVIYYKIFKNNLNV